MKKRMLAAVLAAALLLTACGGGGAKATTMHLKKTEGTVSVADGEGKDVTPREDLGLYSGYGVDTQTSSYAWIDLDEVKLTKMDQDSEIAITKEGKQLEIEVKSGSLFFNITQPLAKDETLDIRTSSMTVGIRGTCGWVTAEAVYILEGTVAVTAGEQTASVSTGEMAYLTEDGALTVENFFVPAVPDFVQEEIESDEGIPEVPDTSEAQPTKRYQYDPDGTLRGYYERTYNDQGQLIRNDGYIMQDGVLTFKTRSEIFYDDQGKRLEMLVYDETGELTERQIPIERTADYIVYAAYDKDGNELYQYTSYLDEQGKKTSASFVGSSVVYEYDQAGRIVRDTNYGIDGAIIGYAEYLYD